MQTRVDESFVNPYTFVPLPEREPQRGAPNGHEGHPELLTGKLSVRIKAATPLLIRGLGERGEDGQRTNALPRRPDGTAFIPGSSHKGAIRSLHETLSGSCLRVFDPDFVPSYRESAQERSERVLAVVTRAPTAEQPPKVRLCKKGDVRKDRLHQDRLRRLGGELRSGRRLNIKPDGDNEPKVELASEGEWVLFLSDGAAREKHKPYHAHVRRLSETEVSVPENVWEKFKAVVEDTDDRRTRRRSQTEGKSTAPIDFEYEPKNGPPEEIRIGHRYLAGPNLECGQPVWVDVDPGQQVTWLGLAMNWRHTPGTTTAGERVGAFQPCDDPQQLCPSCRLFGSIDATERSPREAADQRAYRGHVRVGDAWAVGEPSGVEVTLPPMGAPRPGAGQAYLDNRKISPGAKADPALREWGAPGADGKNPRPLRGRKYYWQAAPNGREQARAHHLEDHADLTTSAEVFPEGTEFRTTITFTDVDEAQLGGLIVALQPSRLLDDSAVQTHIGGGKPLGFGQCRVEIDTADSEVHHNGLRYGLDQPKRDLAEELPVLIDAFRASLSTAVTDTWPLIHRVLHPKAVPGENVWYPPGASWKKRNTGDKEDHKKFDDGFAFWKQTAGFSSSREADAGYPLTSLPQLRAREDQDGDGDDQAMDIVEKDS